MNKKSKNLAKSFAAAGGIVFFFIMAFEVLIMISPFAFFFYSVFNPVFAWLDKYAATSWLTGFFLPHMILPPTLPLKVIRVLGSAFFLIGAASFIALCRFTAAKYLNGAPPAKAYTNIYAIRNIFLWACGASECVFYGRDL
jgi:hypothetical protein